MLFQNWIALQAKERGVTELLVMQEISRKTGYAVPSIYKWKDGQRFPRPEYIVGLTRATDGKVTHSDWYRRFVKPKKAKKKRN